MALRTTHFGQGQTTLCSNVNVLPTILLAVGQLKMLRGTPQIVLDGVGDTFTMIRGRQRPDTTSHRPADRPPRKHTITYLQPRLRPDQSVLDNLWEPAATVDEIWL